MVYEHDIRGCLAESSGRGGLSAEDFAAYLSRTEPALARLRAHRAAGDLPFLAMADRRDDLAGPRSLIERARRQVSDLVVLGTGGSSLGGQTLAALKTHPPRARARLHFADNIDPHDFGLLIEGLDLASVLFVVISKSGGTAETLTQFLIALDAVNQAVGEAKAADRFLVVTEPGENPLRRMASCRGLRVLDHDPGLGGRYSVLSLVGLIPAIFAGVDPDEVRAGAAAVLDDMDAAREPRRCAPACGAALAVGLAERCGMATTVLMPYCDRLGAFAMWFRQLWAESLGKEGKGTTPVRAIGAVDQHSQLQLYLDGPADKMFTLVTLDVKGTGPRVDPALIAAEPALAYLSGGTVGDLCDAEQRATAETLAHNGRPVRVFRLHRLDERTLGALIMHFMLETVLAGALMGVDPFDQPAVEQGKVLARRYLTEAKRIRT